MPGTEVEKAVLGDHPVHGPVVVLCRDRLQDVLRIHQRQQAGIGAGQAQRPVVVAAATAEAIAPPVHRHRGHEDEIGLGDRLGPTWWRGRDGDAEPAGLQISRAGVLRPAQWTHGGGNREKNARATVGDTREHLRAAGLVVVGYKSADHHPGGDERAQVIEDRGITRRPHRRRNRGAPGAHDRPQLRLVHVSSLPPGEV